MRILPHSQPLPGLRPIDPLYRGIGWLSHRIFPSWLSGSLTSWPARIRLSAQLWTCSFAPLLGACLLCGLRLTLAGTFSPVLWHISRICFAASTSSAISCEDLPVGGITGCRAETSRFSSGISFLLALIVHLLVRHWKLRASWRSSLLASFCSIPWCAGVILRFAFTFGFTLARCVCCLAGFAASHPTHLLPNAVRSGGKIQLMAASCARSLHTSILSLHLPTLDLCYAAIPRVVLVKHTVQVSNFVIS